VQYSTAILIAKYAQYSTAITNHKHTTANWCVSFAMNTNLYIVFELVFKFSTPNRISTFPCMCWVSSLNNEAFYIPMKKTAIIIVTCTKCKKILQEKKCSLYIWSMQFKKKHTLCISAALTVCLTYMIMMQFI